MVKETKQDKILAMHEDGATPREIVEAVGSSINSVYAVLYKHGLRANRKEYCSNCHCLSCDSTRKL